MISLRPELITAHHSVSSLSDPLAKPCHAQSISAQLAMWTRQIDLFPARPDPSGGRADSM